MDFKLKDVLDAVGPTASLIFASWIFLSFLQQRYVAAYDRYRQDGQAATRRDSIREQVLLYRRRCEQMRLAVNLGVIAAIFLILPLVCGAINAMLPDVGFLKYIGSASALIGLFLVIAAAVFVIMENVSIQRAMDSELSDIPDLNDTADHPSPQRHPA